MNTGKMSTTCKTYLPSMCLPFFTTNEFLRLVANQWDSAHCVSLVSHTLEDNFFKQVTSIRPPVVVIGADQSLLVKRIIARLADCKNRPIIVVLVESTEESLLTACYQQGADRVIAVPHCSAGIFYALINTLRPRDVFCPPYRFSTVTQTCNIGDRVVRLTTKTFDIARYLFVNHGEIIPKATILKDVWGLESDKCVTRRIEVHMCHVRRQLCLDGSLGWEVRSRRKMGYGIFRIVANIN